MRVMPYKIGSKSAKALAQALRCKRIRHNSTTFTNRRNHLIVNWGFSGMSSYPLYRVLNKVDAVLSAKDKRQAFHMFREHSVITPEWTTDRREAHEWWAANETVVLRHNLYGHSGDGIEVMTGGSYDVSPLDFLIPSAPLYVKYIKKLYEYRYHVFDGRVIDIQQKRKRRSVTNDQVNYQVRSHHTGWVYCRDDVRHRSGLEGLAISAVSALGLDFGAVDIIWNERQQQGYVLEVNTACGLEGETVEIYANAIRGYRG